MAMNFLTVFFILSNAVSNRLSVASFGHDIIDYQNITRLCRLGEFCADQEISTNIDFSIGCKCDEKCGFFGDCCRDSPFFRPSDHSAIQFSCFSPPGSSSAFRMVGSCPEDSSDIEHMLCTSPGDSNPLLGSIPISVNTTDYGIITYRNVHCARCSNLNETQHQLWDISVYCDSILDGTENVTWNKDEKKWANFIGEEQTNCDMRVSHPLNLEIRKCSGERIVDTCPADWKDQEVARLCKSYNAEIRAGQERCDLSSYVTYKNKYCFECHGGNLDDVIWDSNLCTDTGTINSTSIQTINAVRPITALMNITRNHCKYGQDYDPFLEICLTLLPTRKDRDANLLILLPENTEKEVSVSQEDRRSWYAFNATMYANLSDDNMTPTEPQYGQNFTVEKVRLPEQEGWQICRYYLPPRTDDSARYYVCLTKVFLMAASIFFLLAHLCAVALVAELRNLGGISLASLCFALLAADVLYIAKRFLTAGPEDWCFFVAAMYYYFVMSSVTWMTVLAFDIWRIVWESTRCRRAVDGLQSKRFLSYMVIAWGTPLLLTGGVVYAQFAPQGAIDEELRPEFEFENCWFSNEVFFVVFFETPFCVSEVLNAGFFIFAGVLSSNSSVVASHKKRIILYVKLAILLGLPWVTGLLASAFDSEALTGVFAVIYCLQGFFIFVMFTLSSRVLNGLSRTFPCFKSLVHKNGIEV